MGIKASKHVKVIFLNAKKRVYRFVSLYVSGHFQHLTHTAQFYYLQPGWDKIQ